MKKDRFIIAILSIFFFASCDNWLEQENLMGMSEDETYSSEAGITSVAANLYSRLKYWQDFGVDDQSYDLTRWDEATNNSQYWGFADNVGRGYRSYYDYTLVRELNLHISNLQTKTASLPEVKRKYYLAEARYMRAYVYLSLVTQMGGVPIITEVTEYTDNPLALAKPRNKESEVYDFIVNEVDEILEDFGTASSKTRATKGSALALKCRAMLYAGSLAYNYDKSAAKTLNLKSGATGIEKNKSAEYLKKCLDAFTELDKLDYSLYNKKADLAENYYESFVTEPGSNPEIIFCKAYDGVNLKNNFTQRAIARTQKGVDKSGCQINPTLNLVNSYEKLSTRRNDDLDAYVGEEIVESMHDMSSSHQYNVYNKPEDIFAGRDPRLLGTIICPGSSFRGKKVDLQAGLAIPTQNGYEFKAASTISGLASTYEGEKMTGEDGPLCDGEGNWYISHTGFLLKKYVDSASGSELNGSSKVSYVIFRFGEVLLNAAEAAFCLDALGVMEYNGKATKDIALDCINRIRMRAGGETFKLTDSELNFERIVNERRVELAFEDHRYYDLKRWRLADEVWHNDVGNPTANMYALWPYKIYAPGTENNGKWIYRKMKVMHRFGNGSPLFFDNTMYYSTYPMDDGNPYVEKNPNH